MHQIPRFSFYNILRWQISINNISSFELLTSLAHLSKHLRLRDNTFPITYLSDCFCKFNTTGAVEIEMLPIYNTSAQILRHIYFSLNPTNTSGWRDFLEAGFPVEVEGIHSINLRGDRASSSILDFDRFELLDFVPDPWPGDFDFDVFFTKTSQDMNCNYDEVKSALYSKRNPSTCTITDDAIMINILNVPTPAQAESEVKRLCSSAYNTKSQNFEFKDISMKVP